MVKVSSAVLLCVLFLGMTGTAFAEDGSKGGMAVESMLAFAMGGTIAIAAFGGAIGQARAIAASVEAMARQPEAGGRIFGAMVLGLALIETLVIYALLICIFLNGHWPTGH